MVVAYERRSLRVASQWPFESWGRVRDDTLTLLSSTTPGTISGPTIIDAEPLVEAIIRRGDSPHTRRAYALDIQTYATWLGSEGLAWNAVSPDDFDRYRDWLASQYARTTANRRLVVVRALYGEAARRRLIANDPADRLRGVRGRDERDGGALHPPTGS